MLTGNRKIRRSAKVFFPVKTILSVADQRRPSDTLDGACAAQNTGLHGLHLRESHSVNYWLLKSEPETFSFDDLLREKRSVWDGVRNYTARNHLRSMKKGDRAFFYHSGKNPCVVGIVEIVQEAYADPTAEEGDWSVVDVVPVRAVVPSISLKQIKAEPTLAAMSLVTSFRLSVQPVRADEYKVILQMEKAMQKASQQTGQKGESTGSKKDLYRIP